MDKGGARTPTVIRNIFVTGVPPFCKRSCKKTNTSSGTGFFDNISSNLLVHHLLQLKSTGGFVAPTEGRFMSYYQSLSWSHTLDTNQVLLGIKTTKNVCTQGSKREETCLQGEAAAACSWVQPWLVWLGPHRAVCRHRKLLAWPACSRQRHTLRETNSVLTFIDHTRAMLQIIFLLAQQNISHKFLLYTNLLNSLQSPLF